MVHVDGLRVAPFKVADGKFPDWRRVYPREVSEEAATYNPEYLMRGVKAGKAFGVKNPDFNFTLHQNGSGGAVMIIAGGEAHAVVMPFRDSNGPASYTRYSV